MSTEAVEHVFSVMAATYGAAWERSLGKAPMSDIKTVWSHVINQFTHSKDAKRIILWALQNLPEDVPNSREFLALCRKAPQVEKPLLPAPVANPQRMAEELKKLEPLRGAALMQRGEWALRIIRLHEEGGSVTQTQLKMAKDGLANLGISLPSNNHKSLTHSQESTV